MKLLLVNLIICAAPLAFAADENVTRVKQDRGRMMAMGPVGVTPFIGLGAGFTPKNETLNVEGANSNIKLIGSFFPENDKSVFDLGYGAMNQLSTSDLLPSRSINFGVLEYAGRYQWPSRWQTGLVGNTIFGQGSYYGANQADAQFAGLQVIREITLNKGRLARVGARAMQDLNVDQQQVYMGMVDFQFGFGGYGRRSFAENNPTDTMISPQTDTTQIDNSNGALGDMNTSQVTGATEPVTEDVDLQDIAGNHGFITFDSNSTKMQRAEKQKAQHIGEMLSQNQDLFTNIEVVGYADNTGDSEKNMSISVERASQVAAVLENYGLDSENIQVIGKGSSDPMNEGSSSDDLKMNRRVEIRLLGVSDRDTLEKALQME